MGIKETFKKQGGTALLRQYGKSGALFTAGCEFVLLGKSHKALEILRLSAQLKANRKLRKSYYKRMCRCSERMNLNAVRKKSNKVWFCWFQGIENAPELVQKCYKSLCDNLKGHEVVLITEDNMYDYIQFPEHIRQKFEKGCISMTHLSDLLRLELLIRYGGTWIDSTVLCTGGNIPEYMLNSELFLFQCLKPGLDGHVLNSSNWFISAYSNNPLLKLVRNALYMYWNDYDECIDYFIFHHFMQMASEILPEEWDKIVPFSNSLPHMLLLRLFKPYDERIWNAIKSQTPFHKLTYKFESDEVAKKNTFYDVIIAGNV
ncbi:MAG TPA: capsular biosynthesis protein [Ruminococcus sp.]|nr:capsular biosynthesis protein [Ruminococcus sp.]